MVTDPNILMDQARCYRCIPKGFQGAVILYLVDQWAANATACEISWTPDTETPTWTDATGPHTTDLATFLATVDYSTLTQISFNGTNVTSVSFNGCPSLQVLDITPIGAALNSVTITNCTGVTSLSVANEPFLAALDLIGVPNLITLHAENCAIVGVVDLSVCPHIQSADFAANFTITNIILTGCTDLTTLDCNTNAIVTLDCTGLIALTTLNCSANATLTTLTLTGCTGLVTLDCNTCALATLTLPPTATLVGVNCSSNPLTAVVATGATNAQINAQNSSAAAAFLLTGTTIDNFAGNTSQFTSFTTSAGLTTVTTSLDLSDCGNLTSVSLPGLANVGGLLAITNAVSLDTLSVPNLSQANTVSFDTIGSVLLATITLPALTNLASDFFVINCPNVVTVSVNLLATVTDRFYVNNSPNVTAINFPALVTGVDTGFNFDGDTSLPSLVFPAAANYSASNTLSAIGCTSLTSVTLPNVYNRAIDLSGDTSLVSFSLPAIFTMSINCNGCSLNLASVDGILATEQASGATTATIDLSGGANTPPTNDCNPGSNCDLLTIAGCTVITN